MFLRGLLFSEERQREDGPGREGRLRGQTRGAEGGEMVIWMNI